MAASVSFQTTNIQASTVAANGSYTFPLTVAAATGQERLVALAAIAGAGGADFVSCTIDGQSATRVGSVAAGSGDPRACLTFYRAAGTSGTSINVVATRPALGDAFAGYCALWTLNYADTGSVATTNGTTNDPSLNTNTVSDGVVVAALLGFDSVSGVTTWTGVTENFDSLIAFANDLFTGGSVFISSGETPRTISANITPDLSTSAASVCVSFSPSPGLFALAAGSYTLSGAAATDKFTLTAEQAGGG